MKSIMEEASSIIKAIEKAWIRAEKPQNFSIKIFEESEKNFFGITTKSAKIGLFFEEKPLKHHVKEYIKEQVKDPNSVKKHIAPESKKTTVEKRHPKQWPSQPEQQESLGKTDALELKKPALSAQRPPAWSQEMIDLITNWIKGTLLALGFPSVNFSTSVSGTYFKLQFAHPLMQDTLKEKLLYSSIAQLMMATLRSKYKKQFRHIKIIISHA